MSIVVTGRTVKVDDKLYHTGFRAWGTVIGFDTGSAKLSLIGANGQPRILYMQTGGIVNGSRVMYWHEPLALDLPISNVSKYQRLPNAILSEFPP